MYTIDLFVTLTNPTLIVTGDVLEEASELVSAEVLVRGEKTVSLKDWCWSCKKPTTIFLTTMLAEGNFALILRALFDSFPWE